MWRVPGSHPGALFLCYCLCVKNFGIEEPIHSESSDELDDLPNTSGLHQKEAVLQDGTRIDVAEALELKPPAISLGQCIETIEKLEGLSSKAVIESLSEMSDDDMEDMRDQYNAGSALHASYPYFQAARRYKEQQGELNMTDSVTPSYPTISVEQALKRVSEQAAQHDDAESYSRALESLRALSVTQLKEAEIQYQQGSADFLDYPYIIALRNLIESKRNVIREIVPQNSESGVLQKLRNRGASWLDKYGPVNQSRLLHIKMLDQMRNLSFSRKIDVGSSGANWLAVVGLGILAYLLNNEQAKEYIQNYFSIPTPTAPTLDLPPAIDPGALPKLSPDAPDLTPGLTQAPPPIEAAPQPNPTPTDPDPLPDLPPAPPELPPKDPPTSFDVETRPDDYIAPISAGSLDTSMPIPALVAKNGFSGLFQLPQFQARFDMIPKDALSKLPLVLHDVFSDAKLWTQLVPSALDVNVFPNSGNINLSVLHSPEVVEAIERKAKIYKKLSEALTANGGFGALISK